MNRDLHRLNEAKNLYVLKDQRPVHADNPEQWLEWMRTESLPSEETTFASGRKMYTSFMGYSGERRESQPLTFATAFMPEPSVPEFSVTLEWYYSWNEAIAGHKRLTEQFNYASAPHFSK